MRDVLAWFFLSTKGRVSRQEFWLGYLLIVVLMFLLAHFLQDRSLAYQRPLSGPWHRDDLTAALLPATFVAAAIMIWPLFALYVKRLHDIGRSGWWLLAFPAALWVTDAAGLDRLNLAGGLLVTVLGLIPGQPGVNRFGADRAG
jgi:uncharacterized membrane protein YhaH (DUF805 family)